MINELSSINLLDVCDDVKALIDDLEQPATDNRILSIRLEECQTELQQYKACCIELESKLCAGTKKGGVDCEL